MPSSTDVIADAPGLSVKSRMNGFHHITTRIRIRPLSYALLDDLVSSGDLAATTAGQLRTLDIFGTQRTWNQATRGTGPAIYTNCSPR